MTSESKQHFADIITRNKPDISISSIITYASTLNTLYKMMFPEQKLPTNLSNTFRDEKAVLDAIETLPLKRQKVMLSAVIAFNGNEDVAFLHKELIKKKKEDTEIDMKQEKNEKQTDNWMSMEEIKNKIDHAHKIIAPLFKLKELTLAQYFEIVKFMVALLCSGIHFPPRRATDYTEMKWRNYDTETDNYIDIPNKQFVFNKYKTSKFYNTQHIPIPAKVLKFIKEMTAINTVSDYLLIGARGDKLSQQRLSQLLNDFFGKKMSVSMIRHIYLTEKYGSNAKLAEMQKDATEMGHSIVQQQKYIVHNKPPSVLPKKEKPEISRKDVKQRIADLEKAIKENNDALNAYKEQIKRKPRTKKDTTA